MAGQEGKKSLKVATLRYGLRPAFGRPWPSLRSARKKAFEGTDIEPFQIFAPPRFLVSKIWTSYRNLTLKRVMEL